MPDGLVVCGGPGGTTAWLDDLDATAASLAVAGADLGRIAMETGALGRDAALVLSIVLSVGTGLRAEAEILAAVVGPHGLLVGAVRLEGLAVSVRAAVSAYRTTDAAVAATLRALDLAAGRVAGYAAGAGALAVAALAGPSLLSTAVGPLRPGSDASGGLPGAATRHGTLLLGLLGRHPVVTEHLVAALPGAVGTLVPPSLGTGVWGPLFAPSDPREASRLISRLGEVSPWLRESPDVRVTVGPARSSRPAAGVGDLLGRVGTTSPGVPRPDGSVAGPGTVRVERVDAADGSRRWVVQIPGTHRWSPVAAADPFDLTADVRTLGGDSSAVQQTVVRSLDAVGARPDEPVLLVGHSLGGMAAAQLAADPAVRQRFRITNVVTAGSPIALSSVPDHVHVLALEHTDDLVPRLDGTANPDRPTWATVSRPSTPVTGEDPPAALLRTHDVGAYQRTGSFIDASTDPEVVAAREHLAPFLDGPGRTATTWEVQGDRLLAVTARAPH